MGEETGQSIFQRIQVSLLLTRSPFFFRDLFSYVSNSLKRLQTSCQNTEPKKMLFKRTGYLRFVEVRYKCVLLQIKWSTSLSPGQGHSVVFLGKSLYSLSAYLQPGVQIGTGECNAGVNPPMDQHPVQGEQKYSQSLRATETGVNSGLMGHLALMQTLTYLTYLSFMSS